MTTASVQDEPETITFHPDELRTKEFNNFVDQILIKGKVDDDTWHKRTRLQNEFYSVINRSVKRMQGKDV